MFLLNSRLRSLAVAPFGYQMSAFRYQKPDIRYQKNLIAEIRNLRSDIRNLTSDQGRSYCELTTAFLPSSLTRNHPFTLVYSTRPPVLVFGTVTYDLTLENFLGSVLSEVD